MAKLINTVKGYDRDFQTPAATCGVRGDLVQFDKRDIDALCAMKPQMLKNYLLHCIKPRMYSEGMLRKMNSDDQ